MPSRDPIRLLGAMAAGSLVLALGIATSRGDEPAPYGSLGDLKIARDADKVDTPTVAAPRGALVLFDGKSLDQWVSKDGKTPASWKLVDGGAMQAGGGDIRTKATFDGHFRIHVEFRVPYMPDAKGQQRGNSGIYLQGRHEVQVLDSYGLESKDNDCGSIYEVAKPRVNACKAPTVWQSYDIDYQSAVFKDGKKLTPAIVSVTQNGIPIHENQPITVDNTRAGMGGDPSAPGPIMLQDHGNPVQFRNLWIVPDPAGPARGN